MVQGAEMWAITAIYNNNALRKMGSFAAGLVKFGTSNVNDTANDNAQQEQPH